MALILDHFYSAALTECNSLTAIVPVENNEPVEKEAKTSI